MIPDDSFTKRHQIQQKDLFTKSPLFYCFQMLFQGRRGFGWEEHWWLDSSDVRSVYRSR